MTRDEYRAHPALNFSRAKHLLTSAAHFKAASDEERAETDAMRLGTLAHSMVLEGKDLRGLYAIKPEGMSFATTEGKAWRDAQTLPILKEKDAEGIPFMAEAIAKNPDASALLLGCSQVERPILFTLHGVECKALIDLCGYAMAADPVTGEKHAHWALGDFKTVADASLRKFQRTACEMHYDMQIAWYCDGLAIAENLTVEPWPFWIASEKKAPWLNVVYHPTAQMMESGRRKVLKALKLYDECCKSGEWPLPFRGTLDLDPPAWAMKEEPHREGAAA